MACGRVRGKPSRMYPPWADIDALGNLYVANYGNNTVTEYAPPYGGGAWTTLSNGVSLPLALALSPPTNAAAALLP